MNLRYFFSALTFIVTLSGCGRLSRPEFRGLSDYRADSYRDSTFEYSPQQGFSLSVPVKPMVITQYFAPSHNRNHDGIDIAGYKGAPISAAHEGIVVYVGDGFRGYGKMVLVEYSKRWATLYAHLDRIKVSTGETVHQGQTIGTMGDTGNARGVHLHFELMKSKKPIDPMPFLQRQMQAGRR